MADSGLKWIVVAAGALVLFVLLTGSKTLEALPDIRELAGGNARRGAQSAAQISYAEFERARIGMTTAALRSLVGEPEGRTDNRIEGIRLECWYYGMGGTTGAFQLCFADGRLSSKRVFIR